MERERKDITRIPKGPGYITQEELESYFEFYKDGMEIVIETLIYKKIIDRFCVGFIEGFIVYDTKNFIKNSSLALIYAEF